MKKIKIGTRGSKLALYQANKVKDILSSEYPEHDFSIEIIKTKGDKILDVPLSKIGDKGLFTKELEVKLLDSTIDIAVHSLKDLPTEFPAGLKLGAVLERADFRDVLISNSGKKLSELSDGSIIGTSSLRRIAQVLNFNPTFVIKDIRGNVETRLQKLEDKEYDALIMAAAGLIRLGYSDKISEFIDADTIIPATGQGAIAIETRINDDFIDSILQKINHKPTYISIEAERKFLRAVEGGCQIPVGCYTKVIDENKFSITGVIGTIDGKTILKETFEGDINSANSLALDLAEKLLSMGGDEILKDIRDTIIL